MGRQLLSNTSTVGSSAALVCNDGFVPNTTVVTCTADATWIPHPSPCGNYELVFFLPAMNIDRKMYCIQRRGSAVALGASMVRYYALPLMISFHHLKGFRCSFLFFSPALSL